jgi:hypothetical protein
MTELLSNIDFNLNLRRYIKVVDRALAAAAAAGMMPSTSLLYTRAQAMYPLADSALQRRECVDAYFASVTSAAGAYTRIHFGSMSALPMRWGVHSGVGEGVCMGY